MNHLYVVLGLPLAHQDFFHLECLFWQSNMLFFYYLSDYWLDFFSYFYFIFFMPTSSQRLICLCTLADHTWLKGLPPTPPSVTHKGKGKMTNNNTIERTGTSERGFQSDNLTLRLERKIQKLNEEMANMHNLARLSISLGTPFRENMDESIAITQATLLNYPPLIPSTSQIQSNLTYIPPPRTQMPTCNH